MAVPIEPCPRCGYHDPEPSACRHCGWDASGPATPAGDRSLDRRLAGPVAGVLDGLLALPRGLFVLLRTPGIKRWLVPPLLITCLLLAVSLWWVVTSVNELLDQNLPEAFSLDPSWAWLDQRSDDLSWLHASWVWVVGAAEWIVNAGWSWFLSFRWLGWFFLSSLLIWYCFSIAYEAFAGPFLDEIQGRIEARWFGVDPRSALQRPNDIPVTRCIALTFLTAALAGLGGWLLWSPLGAGALLVALPLAFVPGVLFDRRFLAWSWWVATVEGRAFWVSLQATLLTAVLLLLALPLYFVPVVGYFLFAAVTGFATAVGLLDIPFERRGWSLRQRWRFLGRNLLPFLAFGISAGLLLAIPVIGPVLMVPSASIGGLWLICRLDNGFLSERD